MGRRPDKMAQESISDQSMTECYVWLLLHCFEYKDQQDGNDHQSEMNISSLRDKLHVRQRLAVEAEGLFTLQSGSRLHFGVSFSKTGGLDGFVERCDCSYCIANE